MSSIEYPMMLEVHSPEITNAHLIAVEQNVLMLHYHLNRIANMFIKILIAT